MRDPTPMTHPAATPSSNPHALTFRVMRLTTPLPAKTNPPPMHPTDDANPWTSAQPGSTSPSNTADFEQVPPSSTDCPPAEPGDGQDAELSTEQTSESTAQHPDTLELLGNPPTWQAEGAPCGVGTLNILPSSFGSIYASETFRSFTSVFNRFADPVYNVTITIHMQTASSKRIPLYDSSSSPRAVLPSRASINNIVTVALPELGLHVLVCSATYHESQPTSTHHPEPRSLRQVFRFNVLPPLDPTITVHPLFHPHDPTPLPPTLTRSSAPPAQYLVHLRVHNALPQPVFDTRAAFSPNAPFSATPCDRDDEPLDDSDSATITTSSTTANPADLQPADTDPAPGTDPANEPDSNGTIAPAPRRATMSGGDSRNFIFHVYSRLPGRPARAASIDHPLAADAPAPPATPAPRRPLGTLTLTWRSALGETGRLERTVLMPESAPTPDRVAVALYAIPARIRVHRPFIARCVARNNSDRPLRLYLQVRRDLVGEIVPVGVSGVSLGEVAPRQTARCAITLIPLVKGQHSISGVRVVDIDTNVSYKAEPPSVSVT